MDIRDGRRRHVQRAGTSRSGKTTGSKVPFYCTDSSQGLKLFLQWCLSVFLHVHMGVKILDCKYCIHFFLFNDWSSIAAKKNKKKGSTWCLERVIFLYLMPSGFIRGIIEKFLLELFHILFLWYDEFTGLVFFLYCINPSRCLNVTSNHSLKMFSGCSYQAQYLHTWLEWWQIFTF